MEKESRLALHQTGHNSGVIHSGVYYKQGSRKAQFCVEGVKRLKKYCLHKGIEYDQCGKVIVATDPSELPGLEAIYRRGRDNGVPDLRVIDADELAEIEPHARGIKALHVPGTAVVDFNRVSQAYADDIQQHGGEILTGHKLLNVQRHGNDLTLETNQGDIRCRYLINCAGLYADTVARSLGGFQRCSDNSLPRGILRSAPGKPQARTRAGLPRAGPPIPLPGRPLHQANKRRGGGGTQRRSGLGAGGLPQDQCQPPGNPAAPNLRGILAYGAPNLAGGTV